MDARAFKDGDLGAVGAAADALAPELWSIARTGFVCTDDVRVSVRGIDDPDAAETIVIQSIAAVCTPTARATHSNIESVRSAALKEARARLLEYARRTGGQVSVADSDEGLLDFDALIAGDAPASASALVPGIEVEQRVRRELEVTKTFVAALDERSQALVTRRWLSGETVAEVATAFDCGGAAVRERERRVRRKLSHALATAGLGSHRGPARLDGLFSDAPFAITPCAVMAERIRSQVCTRTHPEDAKPFSTRAAWAGGMAAIALGGWLLMLTGALPYYTDDKLPEPAVVLTCNKTCTAGGVAEVVIRAPRNARQVAVLIVDAVGKSHPLLTDMHGRSLNLPFGARQKLVRIPYPATFPTDLAVGTVRAVAVFSDHELSAKVLADVSAGGRRKDGVLTVATTLALTGGG